MTGVPDQLTLDLPHRPALGAEDFLISGSNQAAADIVDRWPDWPHRSVVVVAPPGAGKTHLANVWRLKSGAAAFAAVALREPDVARAKGALLVEDLHAGFRDERALFVFSYLFGLVGTLIAVPLAAATAVLVRFAVQVYLDSSVYKGSDTAPAATEKPKETA